MKKLIYVAMLGVVSLLVSCGNGKTSTVAEENDSIAVDTIEVVVDSIAVDSIAE